MPLYNYRDADKEDLIDLVGLVQDFCEEFKIPYEVERIVDYVMSQLGSIPTVVAVYEGKIVGVISFVVMPTPFSTKELVSRKITYYVSKEHRNSGVGSILRDKAETISKEKNATKFFLSSPLPIKDYKVFEIDYVKEL